MRKFFSLITALVLCTAMWGAATYKTFYKVQGALYQGINVDFTTNKNMFVPNGATVTYSTFDGKPADWWANGKQKKTNVSYITIPDLADANYYKYQIKNYTGYDAQDPKIDYIYGTSSGDYFLRAGSGTMYMMSMANAYCVCTESSTASNVGKYYVDNKSMLTLSTADAKTYGTSMKYGTNFSYAKNGGLIDGYEMLLDNPGEMYIDYIVLPIYASSKDNTMGISNMIPGDAKLTLTLYPIDLTLSDKGIYSYERKTLSITTVTATAENFTANGDNKYQGTVKFTLKEPLLISGDFVARLTWDEGCEFGLITDDSNLQNFTTFYLWKKADGTITKSYMWSSSSANASISYHAMFPVLEKKDTKTALEFTHEGGGDEVAIKSNIDPSSKDFSIDFGGADWISLDSLRYTTEGSYKAKETVYVVFKAEANTGEAREATITLKHHGKVLTYTVSQEAAPAARKEFVFVAGEAAEANPAMFAITWGKDGSNETVKMTQKGEEALYTANILETVDSVVLVRCASDATEIIWDGDGKNVWNQTANYELCDTMSFVTWVEETNLFAIKCDTPEPVETKYYAKNNWNGGEWTWLEMSATNKENVYMLDSVVFGGTGVNINDKEDDTDALWFAADAITVLDDIVGLVPPTPNPKTGDTVLWAPRHSGIVLETPQLLAGDTIKLFFNAADSTLKAFIVGRPAPVARKEFVFVAGEAAEANPTMFAITWGKDGSSETVKMTQKGEEALYTANILETVDGVVLVRCASDATEIIWDGEGKNVWNQTANYELCDTMYFESWVEETNLFAIKCDTPQPVETKYYAKNNWNGAAADNWSWLEMSATNKEKIYMLDSVVFGGTGINVNTKEEDTDAFWFDVDHINVVLNDGGGDGFWSRLGMDTVFPLPLRVAAAEEPQPIKLQAGDTIILVFNAADTTLQAGIYGRLAPAARKEFVFVAGEAAEANPAMFAITWGKDGSNETVKMTQKGEEALYTANILETVDSVVLVRCASDATEIIWDGEGKNVWNQTANYELCDTMYFESWVEETNLFAIKCDTPEPVETKYYAKNNWNGAAADNWSWLEMSATDQENIYMLDSVVFGGTGVNINDKEDDTDALYFAADKIVVLDDLDGLPGPIPPEPRKRDTIPYAPAHSGIVLEAPQLLAGDTIKLFFNAADSTLKAFIVGRPQPVEHKFYVTGNAALVGEEKAWQADAIEMVDDTHTFPMLAAGEYQLKVTDGTWEHAWGYDNLSPTVAVEGLYTDVDGNICFTVYTPNDVTVTFAQGYVVVTGDFTNPTPATPDFGLLVNGTDYLPGTPEDKDTYTEYAVNKQLTIGEFVQLYDNVNKAAWTVTPEGEGFTNFDIHDNAYYIKQTGSYQFYIKIPKEGMESGLYVGFQGGGTNINNLKAQDGKRYNILGLPVDANYRGIVIMNGQTYLQ